MMDLARVPSIHPAREKLRSEELVEDHSGGPYDSGSVAKRRTRDRPWIEARILVSSDAVM